MVMVALIMTTHFNPINQNLLYFHAHFALDLILISCSSCIGQDFNLQYLKHKPTMKKGGLAVAFRHSGLIITAWEAGCIQLFLVLVNLIFILMV